MTGALSAHEPLGAAVVVENVSKVVVSRTRRKLVLDEVSFAVPCDSLCAISGPSGSGKSTLLSILAGIVPTDAGRITIIGQSLAGLTDGALTRWRGRHIGLMHPSLPLLPTLTAEENILLALELGRKFPRADWKRRSIECLTQVRVQELASVFPEDMSDFEQRLVGVARAIVNDPPILLVDEPASSLDSKSRAQLLVELQNLSQQGRTVVFATHDQDLASLGTERVDLLDGRVVARTYGTVPGLYM